MYLFVKLFIVLGLILPTYAGNAPMPLPQPPAEGAYGEDGYEDDGYDDDSYEDDGETGSPYAPGAENGAPPAPVQDVTQDMALNPPQTAEGTRSGFRAGGGAQQVPERLESGRPPEIAPRAPLPPPPSYVPPRNVNAYQEGEVLVRREHPPVYPEMEFGQTDWNQIDLHSLTRKRMDRF